VTAQEAHKTLAMALVAFQRDMPTVGKGKRAVVEHKAGGSHSYKYADLADFVEEAAPVLYAHGLSFSARPQRTDKGDYELVGMLRHVSGESDEGSLPLYGRTPQEIGSSITYGRRYLLGCLTGIVTDDDDDGKTATGTAERTRREATPQEREAQALVAAKTAVKEAWMANHTEWDPDAMRNHYEQQTAQPLDAANADDLQNYARSLLA
jgi:hypothetical protein